MNKKPELQKFSKDKCQWEGVLLGGVLEKQWLFDTLDVHLNPGYNCSLL